MERKDGTMADMISLLLGGDPRVSEILLCLVPGVLHWVKSLG
jgi:hypothetical protein